MEYNPLSLRSHNLFKRCLKCAPLTTISCPPCKSTEVCTLIPYSCDSCARYECQSAADSGAVDLKPTPEEKSPAPQIAGGVVGGVVVIALITFIIWKFVLKGRRREVPVEEWDPMDYPMEKPGDIAPFSRDARSRASTHTVTSMASTVLTRASNVIQIAFIPGVTTRQGAGNQTPNTLVPPVPPIPIPTSSNHHNEEQMLFLPGDLRDSAYSDISTLNGDTRKSLAPSMARSSMASVHQENAVAVSAAKPSLVSVSKSSSPAATPPLPTLDMKRFGGGSKPVMVQMPVSRERLNGSPVGSLGGLKPKAVILSKGKAVSTDSSSSRSTSPTVVGSSSPLSSGTPDKKVFPSSPLAQSRVLSVSSGGESRHSRAKFEDASDDSEDDDNPHERSRQSLMRKESSPFSDSAALDKNSKKKKDNERSNTESPFDDKNAV